MKILFLCHRIPYPPDKGDKIRAFHELRAMAARHEVDLFTLADQPEDMAYREALLQYCNSVTVARIAPKMGRLRALPYLLTRTALTLPYFYSAELAAAVRSALRSQSYDRIFVYCSSMAQYLDGVQGIPVLVDLVDVDSDKWTQYATFSKFPFSAIYRREGRALRRYEKEICDRSSCAIVTTEREARLMREIADSAPVHVIANGVDTSYFDPAAVRRELTAPTVIFTGDMSYFPNQEAVSFFALQVLPLIRESIKEIRFLIVGRNPGTKVLQLQQIRGVEVTGFVPDVRTYLAKSHVAVAPFSIAAGIQNKILEAMAYGLPIVATTRTLQGLTAKAASLVETADTAAEMAARVEMLLRSPERAARKGLEGRQTVTEEYKWDGAIGRLLQLIENLAIPSMPLTLEAISPGNVQ